MVKLNQIIAIEKGIKVKAQDALNQIYQTAQKQGLFSGLTRIYQPRDEDGEPLPPERTHVQFTVARLIQDAETALHELFDVTLTKEMANCQAKANVVVDGQTLLQEMPATYLIYLEKQLTEIQALIKKLPLQDPSETWEWDTNTGWYRSPTVQTNRTKKVMRNHVKAEATDKHPAQVEVYTEDVTVGFWNTVKFTGAIPSTQAQQYLERVEKLLKAVKFAREEANGLTVTNHRAGSVILNYIFVAQG